MRLAFLVVILTAGCLDAGRETQGEAGPMPAPENPEAQLRLQMDGCEARKITSWIAAPLVDVDTPEYWPKRADLVFVDVDALRCKEIRIGGLAFHEVAFLLESHDAAAIPPNCRSESGLIGARIIHQSWSDNSDLVDLLADALQMPARRGEVTFAPATDGVHEEVWVLEADGFEPTTLMAKQLGTEAYRQGEVTFFVWVNRDGGASRMEWEMTADERQIRQPVAKGLEWIWSVAQIHDPFLHPPGLEAYPVFREAFSNATVEGMVDHFSDLSCDNPAGPSPFP